MSTATLLSRRMVLGMALALAACKNRAQIIEISGFSMGTTYNAVVVDHDNQFAKADLKSAIDSALVSFNSKLSNWDANSEISRLNARGLNTPTNMSQELSTVLTASAQVTEASQGRFDTKIGSLIELWGFGATGASAMPTADAIAQAQDQARQADAQVYLAGIGKGFGADTVGSLLESFGIKDYMIEIGGDLYAAGRNPDGLPWQIGIEAPNAADRNVAGVVSLSGLGLATSGDYRNYFEVDGQRYSHLIDPTTGYPVTHKTASATVLHDNAMLADAWSTAMLILGREKGLEIAASQKLAVQFIDVDRSNGQAMFKTTNSAKFEALTA